MDESMIPRRSHRSALCTIAVCAVVPLTACSDPAQPLRPLPELIVFSSPPPGMSEASEVFVIKPDGSGLVQLTTGMRASDPAWSPDGERIAFSGEVNGERSIYVMDADGANLRALTAGPAAYGPEWAPDGKRIAFVVGRRRVDEAIHTIRLDDGDQTLLYECDFGCQTLAWSPDGSRIAFVGWPDNGTFTRPPLVHFLRMDGSAPAPLGTGLPYENFPSWSPDGSKLVFLGIPEGSSHDLYTAHPDGTGLSNLTQGPEQGGSADFSRDGSSIVYFQQGSYSGDENAGLYVMNVDENAQRRITELPGVKYGTVLRPRWRP